nr:immunoglobulin light chain junction region [Mus musculus]
CQQSTEVPWTF